MILYVTIEDSSDGSGPFMTFSIPPVQSHYPILVGMLDSKAYRAGYRAGGNSTNVLTDYLHCHKRPLHLLSKREYGYVHIKLLDLSDYLLELYER